MWGVVMKYFLLFLLCTFTLRAEPFWYQTNGPHGGHVTDIIKDEDGTLYLGTFNTGLFRSVDGGYTWESINDGIPQYEITALVQDHRGSLYAAVGDKGVYVSQDKGNSWQSLSSGIENEMVQSLYIDTDETIFIAPRGQGVYKSTDNGSNWESMGLQHKIFQTFLKLPNGYLFVGGNNGDVYRLAPGSETWEQKNSGIPNITVKTLAYAPWNKALYAGTYSGGVLRSFDNGDSWTPINDGFANYIYGWIEELHVADQTIYACASHDQFGGLYNSTDNGDSWQEINVDLSHKNLQSLFIEDNGIFVGTFKHGIYFAKNPFDTWETRNTGLWYFRATALTSNKQGTVFAGTQGGGFYRTMDLGAIWRECNTGNFYWNRSTLYCDAEDNLFGGIFLGGFFISTDGGDSWERRIVGLSDLDIHCFWSQDQTLIIGTSVGLFKTDNLGKQWQRVGSTTGYFINCIKAVQDGLIIGTKSRGLLKTTDELATWTSLSADLPNVNVSSLILHGSELIAALPGNGVFKSTDSGVSWQDVTFDLSNTLVNISISDGAHIYVGTNDGVFRLHGNQWQDVNEGLWNRSIHDLHIDSRGYLWAATDIGVSRSASKVTNVVSITETIPATLQLKASYPNPFNATTTFEFSIPNTDHVVLSIYNISGQRVKTLVDEIIAAGNHSIRWSAEDAPSGLYIVQLRTGKQIVSRKIVLQK